MGYFSITLEEIAKSFLGGIDRDTQKYGNIESEVGDE